MYIQQILLHFSHRRGALNPSGASAKTSVPLLSLLDSVLGWAGQSLNIEVQQLSIVHESPRPAFRNQVQRLFISISLCSNVTFLPSSFLAILINLLCLSSIRTILFSSCRGFLPTKNGFKCSSSIRKRFCFWFFSACFLIS